MSEVFTAPRMETPAQQVDRRIADLTGVAQRREQLLRLMKNRDFKALILQYFMVEEASRYIQASLQPGLTAEQRADAMSMAQATGHLKRFFDVLNRMGEQAVAELSQIHENYEELTQLPVEESDEGDDE